MNTTSACSRFDTCRMAQCDHEWRASPGRCAMPKGFRNFTTFTLAVDGGIVAARFQIGEGLFNQRNDIPGLLASPMRRTATVRRRSVRNTAYSE